MILRNLPSKGGLLHVDNNFIYALKNCSVLQPGSTNIQQVQDKFTLCHGINYVYAQDVMMSRSTPAPPLTKWLSIQLLPLSMKHCYSRCCLLQICTDDLEYWRRSRTITLYTIRLIRKGYPTVGIQSLVTSFRFLPFVFKSPYGLSQRQRQVSLTKPIYLNKFMSHFKY